MSREARRSPGNGGWTEEERGRKKGETEVDRRDESDMFRSMENDNRSRDYDTQESGGV